MTKDEKIEAIDDWSNELDDVISTLEDLADAPPPGFAKRAKELIECSQQISNVRDAAVERAEELEDE